MLYEVLKLKRSSVIRNWTNQIFETYASETSSFLTRNKNQFSNPVGFTITENAGKIVDEIINGRDYASIKILLIDIIKIRAVQDFTPSEAVGFIPQFKYVLKDELADELSDERVFDEYLDLCKFIDRVTLIGFDIYTELRERIYRIRVNELKNRTAGVVQ
jgi:hypothetical protein